MVLKKINEYIRIPFFQTKMDGKNTLMLLAMSAFFSVTPNLLNSSEYLQKVGNHALLSGDSAFLKLQAPGSPSSVPLPDGAPACARERHGHVSPLPSTSSVAAVSG
jgi:hypothetical protein